MQVKLNDKELREAVEEWCVKRGINATAKSITVGISFEKAYAIIEGVEALPQFGPYR